MNGWIDDRLLWIVVYRNNRNSVIYIIIYLYIYIYGVRRRM